MINDWQFGLLGMVIILLLATIGYITWLNYTRNKIIDSLRIAHFSLQKEQEFMNLKLEIHEHTLQNINYQIHDNIGQVLSLAKLYVSDIQDKQPDCGLQETHILLIKAITDLRYVSKSLQTARICKQPILDTISYELGLLEKIRSMKTELTVSGLPHEIRPERKVLLLNIFQAVIANTLQYAENGLFHAHLAYGKETMKLIMDDLGTSNDIVIYRNPILAGITGHLHRLKGKVDIKSLPGAGTRIAVQVPY